MRWTGRLLPLPRADVDTDQIVPKQFLKRIERTGFGPFLFHDWRQDPAFVLNQPRYQGASVLVAGPNFGCGSSREHAGWALLEAGIRVVIAASLADIFRNNCLKIGLLPVTLPEAEVEALLALAEQHPSTEVSVDLEAQTVSGPGLQFEFEVDPFARFRLLNGLDEIALTMEHEEAIARYEAARPGWMPAVRA